MQLGADGHRRGGAGHRQVFVGRQLGGAALALAAHFAAACMQGDAGLLVGAVGVADLAVGKEADARLDQVVVPALGPELDGLACGDAAGGARAEDGVGRGQGLDAAGGAELQQRLAVGIDLLVLRAVLGGADLHVVRLGCDGGEFVGRAFGCQFGVVLLCGIGQTGLQLLAAVGLGLGFGAVELAAAGACAGVGAEQEARACAGGGAVGGFEFSAPARRVQALVVALVLELAQVELGGALVGLAVLLQHGAGLGRAVVKDELVVAARAVLAGRQGLGFDAAEYGGVGVALA